MSQNPNQRVNRTDCAACHCPLFLAYYRGRTTTRRSKKRRKHRDPRPTAVINGIPLPKLITMGSALLTREDEEEPRSRGHRSRSSLSDLGMHLERHSVPIVIGDDTPLTRKDIARVFNIKERNLN